MYGLADGDCQFPPGEDRKLVGMLTNVQSLFQAAGSISHLCSVRPAVAGRPVCCVLGGHEMKQPTWVDAPHRGFFPGELPRPGGGVVVLVTAGPPGLC